MLTAAPTVTKSKTKNAMYIKTILAYTKTNYVKIGYKEIKLWRC